jgi:DNA-binding response OmpR family regulator
MSAVDDAFDSAFASLRDRYISNLHASIAELKKFAVLCDFDETNAEIATTVSHLAHRLSGTGETLGFPEISSKAMALERVVESNVISGDAADAARALARACEAAMGADNNAIPPKVSDLPDGPGEMAADLQAAIPDFLAIHSDPVLEALTVDVCAGRAHVTNLATCSDALSFLNEKSADLILIDLDGSGCPPDEIAALYKQTRKARIPIIAIASSRRSATILHALSEGEIECIFKPVEAALLHGKLFEILERQHLLAVICDDDPVIREFLKPRFEARGFQVQLAKDGDELLEIARRIRPSIIVLDRVMPGLDGLDVLRALKSNSATHRIPVVILTSKSQPRDVTEGLRIGAAAYLAKPFSPDQVLAKCLEILGLGKLARA